MIKLNLAIGSGDIPVIGFENVGDLLCYVNELTSFENRVWLLSDNSKGFGFIHVTEDINEIEMLISDRYVLYLENELHIHEYESYEDAYSVALSMREPNPLCYNNKGA